MDFLPPKLSLLELPNQLIINIMSYLDVTTCYLTLASINKRMFILIFSDKYIPFEYLQQLIGAKLSKELFQKFDYSVFFDLLKQIYYPDSIDRELPFYGYKGDCGSDENDPKYLFNYIFKTRR